MMFLSWLTPKLAMEHERRVCGVESHVRLGWRPYNITITRDACSWWACHTARELRAFLRRENLRLEIFPQRRGGNPRRVGRRVGKLHYSGCLAPARSAGCRCDIYGFRGALR